MNTYVLSQDKFPLEPAKAATIKSLNDLFTYIFMLEMFIKVNGLGFREYARDTFNLFDAFIVIVSIVEWVLNLTMK